MTAAGRGGRPPLIVIGLDSATPEHLFGICLPKMPNVRRLLARGAHSVLRSTDPPISIPSWPVMLTGVDPGTLGLYGFRHRKSFSYTETYGPTSKLPVPSVWELFSSAGRRVCTIGMPLGYPPLPVNGLAISDFLTPAGATDWTYPPSLAHEIEGRYGHYRFDVTFRASERRQLYRDIVQMTQQRWAIAEDLYQREPWDVFAIHEIGVDRLHHAYTKYFDPSHQAFVPGNPFEHVVEEYYGIVDECIGRLLATAPEDAVVVIVSDHGSMPMAGCFCINSWLAERGYLKFRTVPTEPTPFEKCDVDWATTTVWGAGGYYARLFFNVRGRDPQGTVDPADVPALRARLLGQLGELKGPDGGAMPVRILDPHTAYRSVVGDPPDLMAYFGELKWRSAGSVGHPGLYLKENDTGPDDAVHSYDGVFALYDPRATAGTELAPQAIMDVAPTLLAIGGLPIPAHVQGRRIPADVPSLASDR
ncbi:MAG TPA: alkaline phosphatase family protein [Thermoplasmata archaeon]|nr:alkaline phosphatase family protein [Thermoplasmata archaeon]